MTEASDVRFKRGDFYEDCMGHPCLVTDANVGNENPYDDDIEGISLVDGSTPRNCSIKYCAPRRLSLDEAIALRDELAGRI